MAAITHSAVSGLISVQTAAYNDNCTRLATCSNSSKVEILDRSEDQQIWRPSSILPIKNTPDATQVAWAHSEHGSVIACASADGLVIIWQQTQANRGQEGSWLQRATLKESIKPITCLQFAPQQLGPQLAAASEDGYVRFYEASSPINADSWKLSNDLQASTSGPCTCLSWRQHTYGLPPMLCVGTASGAHVWYYRSTLGDWVEAAVLDTGNEAVTALDWAPALGRPVELIAVASHAGSCVWSLKGKVHDLQVQQMTCVSLDGQTVQDCLPVDGHVWKTQFDNMGTLLATSALGDHQSDVCIWELNPDGQWYLLSKIVGDASSNETSSRMLE